MKLAFRPVGGRGTEERGFVVSTWSRSYKSRHSAGLITSEDWPAVMHPQLEKHLDRAGARTILAYEKGDPNFFYGWIAGDTSERVPVVYYAYVKEAYRRAGVARALLDAIGIDPSLFFVYVCDGPSMGWIAGRITHARYNPSEVRYPKQRRPV